MKRGKTMKKTFALILAAVLLCAAFAGCSKKDPNTIVYGTSADYAPYEFHTMIDGKDTIVGYDVSLAKFIASEAGKKLTIKDINFDYLMQELQNGTIDMVIAAIEEDETRLKVADFSDPYYTDEPPMILIRKADNAKFTSIASFSGLTVGAQTATTKEALVQNDMEGAKLLSLSDVIDLVAQLKAGKCDAVVLDAGVARQYAEVNSDLAISTVALGEAAPYRVAVAKGDPRGLLPVINAAIAKAKEQGLLDSWMDEAMSLPSDEK